jgi:hypothetical protein
MGQAGNGEPIVCENNNYAQTSQITNNHDDTIDYYDNHDDTIDYYDNHEAIPNYDNYDGAPDHDDNRALCNSLPIEGAAASLGRDS